MTLQRRICPVCHQLFLTTTAEGPCRTCKLPAGSPAVAEQRERLRQMEETGHTPPAEDEDAPAIHRESGAFVRRGRPGRGGFHHGRRKPRHRA